MKKIRVLRDTWTEEDVQFLANYGIEIKTGRQTIKFEEDSRYFEIKKHYEHKWNSSNDSFYYEYSTEEIDSADYYLLRDFAGCGYPQPETDYKYEYVVFDGEKLCPKCKCGRVQINNMRVNKLSKRGFWGYFAWLNDELFVSDKVYNEVFAPYGIQKRDLVKGGKVVENIYQLVIPVIDEPLNLSDREYSTCPVCGRAKYDQRYRRYPFFPLHEHPLPGIYRTMEYFGEGGEADHAIIVSKDVAQKLIKLKEIKDYCLIPCRRKVSD